MCKATRILEFPFSATLVLLFAIIALAIPLENDCRLGFASCLLQRAQESQSARPGAPSKLAPASLDINLASAEDFQKLPGVGPKLAQRIVAYRQKHGPFRRVEDLMAIQGVGFKKWKAIRPYLRVGRQEKK